MSEDGVRLSNGEYARPPWTRVTVHYVGGYAAHLRAGLLSYMNSRGAQHEPLTAAEYPQPICPPCTYASDDVTNGVAWPCSEATS